MGVGTGYTLFGPKDTIDLSKVRIKKPYEVSGNLSMDILYGEENLQIFLQTPECMIPYGYQIVDDKSLNIDAALNHTEFTNMVSGLLDLIRGRLEKCMSKLLRDKRYICPLRDKVLRMKNPDVNQVQVFNNKNKSIQLADLKRGDRVIMIFQVEKAIVFNGVFYIYLKALQIKKQNEVKDIGCLFEGGCKTVAEAIPEKYQKMLDMGIPRAAVEHKMVMDGYKSATPSVAVLLKATPLLKAAPPAVPKKSLGVDKTKTVPSLTEILQGLKNLRSSKQISGIS